MRQLFLGLLLANLGVFALFHWVDPPAPPREPYSGPGITLLREVDHDRLARARPAPAATDAGLAALPPEPDVEVEDAPVPVSRCVAIGPFADAADAGAAADALREAGLDPVPETREIEIWDGYWVYLDDLESVPRAREIEAELQDNEVRETLVIANSESGILISLGVFREVQRAAFVAERAAELGYETIVTDSTRTADTVWLQMTLTGPGDRPLEILAAPGRISRLEQAACAAPAPAIQAGAPADDPEGDATRVDETGTADGPVDAESVDGASVDGVSADGAP